MKCETKIGQLHSLEREREKDHIIASLVSPSIHLSNYVATVITPLPHHHGYTLLPAHLHAFRNL